MASYEYSPPMQYEVFCHACGAKYLEQDEAVDFMRSDHVWACADEAACLARQAEQERTV